MNNLFVYCEIEDGIVADVSLELLTKGRSLANQLNCQLEAVVAGSGLKEIEKQILPYGVDKLHVFDGEGLYPYTSLPHTSILVNLSGDTAGNIEFGTYRNTGLSDLAVVLNETCVYGCTAGTYFCV